VGGGGDAQRAAVGREGPPAGPGGAELEVDPLDAGVDGGMLPAAVGRGVERRAGQEELLRVAAAEVVDVAADRRVRTMRGDRVEVEGADRDVARSVLQHDVTAVGG